MNPELHEAIESLQACDQVQVARVLAELNRGLSIFTSFQPGPMEQPFAQALFRATQDRVDAVAAVRRLVEVAYLRCH